MAPVNDPIQTAIDNATILIEAKRDVASQLQAARDFLNQAVKIGAVTDEQAQWIAENLPKNTKARLTPAERAQQLRDRAAELDAQAA